MIVGDIEIVHAVALDVFEAAPGGVTERIDVEDLIVGSFRTVIVAKFKVTLCKNQIALDQINVPQVTRRGGHVVSIIPIAEIFEHLANL